MSEECRSVLLFLEGCIAPMKADTIADRLALPIECAYAALVNLYDNGLARIARKPRTGEVAGWESA